MSLGRTQIWRLHTELNKFAWKVSANNSQTVHRTDLRLGQIVYLFHFYNILSSKLLSLNGFDFIFPLRDSENSAPINIDFFEDARKQLVLNSQVAIHFHPSHLQTKTPFNIFSAVIWQLLIKMDHYC